MKRIFQTFYKSSLLMFALHHRAGNIFGNLWNYVKKGLEKTYGKVDQHSYTSQESPRNVKVYPPWCEQLYPPWCLKIGITKVFHRVRRFIRDLFSTFIYETTLTFSLVFSFLIHFVVWLLLYDTWNWEKRIKLVSKSLITNFPRKL